MRWVGLALAVCAVLLAACAAPAAQAVAAGTPIPPARASAAPSATGTPTPQKCLNCGSAATQTAQAGQALAFTATAAVERRCMASQPVCSLSGHFLLRRPIGPVGGRQSIERSYPYGSTQGGMREPHHGVEFSNAQGTPVLAAADGKVVFAGDDKKVTLAWVPAYYGKVIVLEHRSAGLAQVFYTLYAHLYKIEVKVGQQVSAGERIGQVGSSGTAIGSHLHFEVRMAANNYKSNRNPELWLATLPGTGVLAGHIEDAQGNFVAGRLNLQRMLNGVLAPLSVAAPETYATKERDAVGADDAWQEGFAVGELPAGDYRLTLVYNGAIYEQLLSIEPGRLTLVRMIVGK